MNCGFLLADKWRWYQEEVTKLRIKKIKVACSTACLYY
jgi:hypothetical protein